MGGRYENEVCAMAEALGYCAFPARGSRGPVDIVAFEAASALDFVPRYTEPLVSLAIQVGTTAKPIARTLEDLEAAPRPIGSLCVVARRVRAANRRVSWRFHSSAGTFATLAEAIDGGRAPSA
jgi:hypothetical protein